MKFADFLMGRFDKIEELKDIPVQVVSCFNYLENSTKNNFIFGLNRLINCFLLRFNISLIEILSKKTKFQMRISQRAAACDKVI